MVSYGAGRFGAISHLPAGGYVVLWVIKPHSPVKKSGGFSCVQSTGCARVWSHVHTERRTTLIGIGIAFCTVKSSCKGGQKLRKLKVSAFEPQHFTTVF